MVGKQITKLIYLVALIASAMAGRQLQTKEYHTGFYVVNHGNINVTAEFKAYVCDFANYFVHASTPVPTHIFTPPQPHAPYHTRWNILLDLQYVSPQSCVDMLPNRVVRW